MKILALLVLGGNFMSWVTGSGEYPKFIEKVVDGQRMIGIEGHGISVWSPVLDSDNETYNGASFGDWKKYHLSYDYALQVCKLKNWQGNAPAIRSALLGDWIELRCSSLKPKVNPVSGPTPDPERGEK